MKKQIAAITLATTLGLSLQPIIGAAETNQNVQATQQNGWIEEGNGTWFFYDHGVKKTGWVLSNDKWYYLDGNAGGAMKTGWYQEGEKWFYLDPSAEGPKGAKKVGWAQVNGKWYYLDPTTDGSMKTGWVQVHGRWFYLDGNDGGAMKTGWTQVNGRWFYLDAEGAMKTGWVLSNDKWYYLDAEGVMKTGWYQEGEKWFYLDPSAEGAKKVGWAEVNGKWYYLDPTTDGSMKTGWVQVNGKWYYLDGNKGGMMVTGQVVIDGKTYDFANDGQWIESNYQMPIKNPNVSSGYGPRGNKQHKGIDFAAPAGTPILAAKSGTVEFSAFGTQGSFGGYGNVVVLKHADGHYTLYAHMSQRIAQKGEYVQQGQEIGKVGQTGDATGNHLHFELKTAYQFGQINPAPYLPFK